jgi:uncharacterized UPF0160 family protein
MIIATHSGTFHADECLAIHILRKLPEYATATVLRTRDESTITKADMAVDVGAIYDPSTHRYDHHQRSFQETWPNYLTKLSSAGLIYKHFGKRAISTMVTFKELDWLYEAVYERLIHGFDAVDNGVSMYPVDIVPAYRDNSSIASRVARLNPAWNQSPVDSAFEHAIKIVGDEFDYHVLDLANSYFPARSIVKDAIANRFSAHDSGKIVVLDRYCPWKEHLHLLEKELEVDPILYVVYGDEAGSFRVQAVGITPTSFETRKGLPEPWRVLYLT